MITLDANDEILLRESPTDKEGLVEICTFRDSKKWKIYIIAEQTFMDEISLWSSKSVWAAYDFFMNNSIFFKSLRLWMKFIQNLEPYRHLITYGP